MAWTNILDGTSTSFSTSNPHTKIQLKRHNTVGQTEVQVELAVRAQRTSGTGDKTNNKVGLRSASGIEIYVNNIGDTAQWYTATGTLPADSTALEMVATTEGEDTIRVDAVTVLEYEA